MPESSPRYRWIVLAAGCGAQASFATVTFGLPMLAPAIRNAYELSLADIGLLLASVNVGILLSLLPWGFLTDHLGERVTITTALFGASGALAGAVTTESFLGLATLLALTGAAGAGVISGTGRAVMAWFGPEERGLALGIRQTAIPVAGAAAAVTLPWLAGAADPETALLVLACSCFAGAVGGFLLRPRAVERATPGQRSSMLRERRLWRLSAGSVLVCVAQIALVSYLVLFLHDARDVSLATAGAVLAGGQVIAAVLRIGLGALSDRMDGRILLLRRVALVLTAAIAAVAALAQAPLVLLFPAATLAVGLSAGWNSLSFTAAVEMAGVDRSGSAIGLQQTALAASAVVVPVVFAATVDATSWSWGFAFAALAPLAGAWVLRPLVSDETARRREVEPMPEPLPLRP